MANGVWFGSSEMDAVKLGSSTVDKIYLGSDLVWPTLSGFATGTISAAGQSRTGNGTYSATQFATSGSGSGATFSVTLVSKAVTSFTITAAGTGYAVSDTVTLQIGTLSSGNQSPRAELTVSTLG